MSRLGHALPQNTDSCRAKAQESCRGSEHPSGANLTLALTLARAPRITVWVWGQRDGGLTPTHTRAPTLSSSHYVDPLQISLNFTSTHVADDTRDYTTSEHISDSSLSTNPNLW